MNKTKDEKLQLNEEHVNSNKVTNHKEDKNMRKRTIVTAMAMVMMMALLAGCEKTTPPTVTVGSAADPTPTVAPTEEVVAPTEVEAVPTAEATPEATPTEAVVEDNPNVIEGVDFTSFNAGGTIRLAMSEVKFDEPKLVVTRKVMSMSGQQISAIGFLSNGEHYVEEAIEDKPEDYMKTNFIYYIYAPKEIKSVTYNKETISIDVNGEGRVTDADHISSKEADAKEIDGVKYPKLFYFGLNDFAVVTDDEVTITINYEDGASDQMTVFLTKEYVDYGN